MRTARGSIQGECDYRSRLNSRRLLQLGFPGGSDGKESTCNEGDLDLIPGVGRSPWRREWTPTPVFLPGEFHGQRSLAGYSPWGPQKSDTTERLTLSMAHQSRIY